MALHTSTLRQNEVQGELVSKISEVIVNFMVMLITNLSTIGANLKVDDFHRKKTVVLHVSA